MITPELRNAMTGMVEVSSTPPEPRHIDMVNYILHGNRKRGADTHEDWYMTDLMDKADKLNLTDAEFMACWMNASLTIGEEI